MNRPVQKTAQEFKRIAWPKELAGAKSYEMYCAILLHAGEELFNGAPTVGGLARAWERICGVQLDRSRVQRVAIAGLDAPQKPPPADQASPP